MARVQNRRGSGARAQPSSTVLSARLCSRCRGGFRDPLSRPRGRVAEPGPGCSAAAGWARVLEAEPACCGGRFGWPGYSETGRGRPAGREAQWHSRGRWDGHTSPQHRIPAGPGGRRGVWALTGQRTSVLLRGFASVTLLSGGGFNFCKACRALLPLPIQVSHR